MLQAQALGDHNEFNLIKKITNLTIQHYIQFSDE